MRGRDIDRVKPDDLAYVIDPERDLDVDIPDDDGGAFHDPVLRRALAHAPDHAVVPMEETRESILSFAHEAVAPSLPAALPRNVLQRMLGLRGGPGIGALVPWNAVLAMVVIGAVVVARDRWPAGDAVPEPSTTAPEVVAVPPTAGTPGAVVAVRPDAAVAPAPTASASAAPASVVAAVEPAPGPQASSPPTPTPTSDLLAFSAPPAESPADAAARLQLEQKLQRLEAAEARARLAQHTDAAAVPASLFPSALPRTAIPVEVQRGGRAVATLPGVAPATATADRAVDAPPPNFIALSQWTRLTITSSGGESWRVARADSRELGALVGSAALAGVSPQPLSGRVDWRIVFERNGEPLATLETAGGQIRWKENGMPAGTGAPSGSALTSLRQALKESQAEVARSTSAPTPMTAAPAAPAVPAPSVPAPTQQPEISPATSAPGAAPAFEMPR